MRSPKSWSATLDCPKWKAKETWCLQRVGPQAMSVRTLRVYFPICQPDRLSLALEPGTCLHFPWGRNKKIERHWNKLKEMWFSLKPSPEILFDLGVSLRGGQELIWVSSLFLRPEIQHMYLCFQIFTVTRWDSSKVQTHTKHLNADISTGRKKRLIRGVWFKPWPSHSLGLSWPVLEKPRIKNFSYNQNPRSFVPNTAECRKGCGRSEHSNTENPLPSSGGLEKGHWSCVCS